MKNWILLYVIVLFFCSCASAVKIKTFTAKFTDKELTANLEMLNDTAYKSGKISAEWIAKLKAACTKNNVNHTYTFTNDSTKLILNLRFADINYVNAFLFDMDLKTSKNNEDFPLNIYIKNTSDSVYFSLDVLSKIFYSPAYISIETPTNNSYFYPWSKRLYLQPEKVAPNKMDYYFTPDTNLVEYKISCSFKKYNPFEYKTDTAIKAGALRTDSLKQDTSFSPKEETINLFGFRQKYWEFWCTVIGGIASAIGIVAFFKKK